MLRSIDLEPLRRLTELIAFTVVRTSLCAWCGTGELLRGTWVQPCCSVAVACNDCYLVGVVAGEVGVDENEQICHSTGK
jgi:hypothetical protein